MTRTLTFLIAGLAFSALAFAHGVEAPKHGGVMAQVDDINYELVAKADSIAIYVSEHGKNVATTGATAKVTLLSGGAKSAVELAPAGDNKLAATGVFTVAVGTKVVSQVTLAGKPSVTARFELK